MVAREIEGWYVNACVGKWETSSMCVTMHFNKQLYLCVCALTLRQAVPDIQPVVLAIALSHQQGVVLQVKGQEGEGDVHAGRGDDHVGALQVVRVFIREARGLDHAGGAGEVAEAELRP